MAVASGPGRALDAPARKPMESTLGHDFAHVRIHDDSTAATLSRGVGAQAFTVAEHVALAEGGYRPGVADGDRLLAHELAHVIQQSGGHATRPPATGATVMRRSRPTRTAARTARCGRCPHRRGSWGRTAPAFAAVCDGVSTRPTGPSGAGELRRRPAHVRQPAARGHHRRDEEGAQGREGRRHDHQLASLKGYDPTPPRPSTSCTPSGS